MANTKVSPDGRLTHNGTINRGGVAKSSHFMLTFTAPSSGAFAGRTLKNDIGLKFLEEKGKIVTWEQEGLTNIAFRCERITLPGRIIITSSYKEGNYGLNREYPTNAVYQPVDATFLMSSDYSEKIFFELWQDLIVGHTRTQGDVNPRASTKDLNYISNFTCQMQIHCFDSVGGRGGSPTLQQGYSCTLHEAYPRTIQDIQLDWGANDLVRLNVVFDYKYFEDQQLREISSAATEETGGFLARTGLGAGLGALGGRAIAGLSPTTQSSITGLVTAAPNALRVASKLF